MNLATARSAERAREVGIRKALGSGRRLLTVQFLIEAILVALLAVLIATGLVWLVLPGFNQLAGKDYVLLNYLHCPVSWYLMNQWLTDFAYRIQLQWWMFVLAGALAVGIAFLTVGFQSIKAALANPVKSLRSE